MAATGTQSVPTRQHSPKPPTPLESLLHSKPNDTSPWNRVRASLAQARSVRSKQYRPIDFTKVLQTSFELEKESLKDVPFTAPAAFSTPRKQVEMLERTSQQLKEINNRVHTVLREFEYEHNQTIFQLFEELDDTKFRTEAGEQSVVEENRGRIKVLIVDYNRLCMERQAVLDSLKRWFDFVNSNDPLLKELLQREQESQGEAGDAAGALEALPLQQREELLRELLQQAQGAKNKLLGIHTTMKELLAKHGGAAREDGDGEQAAEPADSVAVERLRHELDEALRKLRESESRAASLAKALERKSEELNFYKKAENSKTGQLKQELFQAQQRFRERERGLMAELDKLTRDRQTQPPLTAVALQASQASLEELAGLQRHANALQAALRAKDLEAAEMRCKMEADIATHRAEVEAARARAAKDLEALKAQLEELHADRMAEMQAEFEAQLRKQREDHVAHSKQVEKVHAGELAAVRAKMEDALAKRDGGEALLDLLKKTHAAELEKQREAHARELQLVRDESSRKERQGIKEWKSKYEAQVNLHRTEVEALKVELEETCKKKLAVLRQEAEAKAIKEAMAAHKKMEEIKAEYTDEIMKLRSALAAQMQQLAESNELAQSLQAKLVESESREKATAAALAEQQRITAQTAATKEAEGMLSDDVQTLLKNLEQKLRKEWEMEKQAMRTQMNFEKEVAIEAARKQFEAERDASIGQLKKQIVYEKKTAAQQLSAERASSVELVKMQLTLQLQKAQAQIDEQKTAMEAMEAHHQRELAAIRESYDDVIRNLRGEYSRMLQDALGGGEGGMRALVQHVDVVEMQSVMAMLRAKEKAVADLQELVERLTAENRTLRAANPATSNFSLPAAPPRTPGTEDDALERMNARVDKMKAELFPPAEPQQPAEEPAGSAIESTPTEVLVQAQEEHSHAVRELIALHEQRHQELEGRVNLLTNKVRLLTLENERLRQRDPTAVQLEAAISTHLLELKAMHDHLNITTHEKAELDAKLAFLTSQLMAKQDLLVAAEARATELAALVKSLEAELARFAKSHPQSTAVSPLEPAASVTVDAPTESYKSPLTTNPTYSANAVSTTGPVEAPEHPSPKRTEAAIARERAEWQARVAEMDSKFQREKAQLQETLATTIKNSRREIEVQREAHNEIVKALTLNYEKRVKALTDALSARLESDEVVEELKREASEKLHTANLHYERLLLQAKDEQKRAEERLIEEWRVKEAATVGALARLQRIVDSFRSDVVSLLAQTVQEAQKDTILPNHVEPLNQLIELLKKLQRNTLDVELKQQRLADAVEREADYTNQVDQMVVQSIAVVGQLALSALASKDDQVRQLEREVLLKQRLLVAVQEEMMKYKQEATRLWEDTAQSKMSVDAVVSEQRTKMAEQGMLLDAFRERHIDIEKTLLIMKEKADGLESENSSLKEAVEEREKTIRELQLRVANYKKQQTLQDKALAAIKQKLAIDERRGSIPRYGLTSPPVPGATGRTTDSIATFRARKIASAKSSIARSLTLLQSKSGPLSQFEQQAMQGLSGLKMAIHREPLIARGAEQQVAEVAETSLQVADAFLQHDKELRIAKVGTTFMKLRERVRLRKLQQQMEKEVRKASGDTKMKDKLATVLMRMEERHQQAIERWERKKQQIIAERQRNLELVLAAFTAFSSYFSAHHAPRPAKLSRSFFRPPESTAFTTLWPAEVPGVTGQSIQPPIHPPVSAAVLAPTKDSENSEPLPKSVVFQRQGGGVYTFRPEVSSVMASNVSVDKGSISSQGLGNPKSASATRDPTKSATYYWNTPLNAVLQKVLDQQHISKLQSLLQGDPPDLILTLRGTKIGSIQPRPPNTVTLPTLDNPPNKQELPVRQDRPGSGSSSSPKGGRPGSNTVLPSLLDLPRIRSVGASDAPP